jgi:hypothetical protein
MTSKQIERWRQWAEREIGGAQDRVEAATQGAITAFAKGATDDDAMTAAFVATAGWDYQHRDQPAFQATPSQGEAQPVAQE